MKILNLYAGIGGNRKLWGNKHQITAVEYDERIAKFYHDFFPDDELVIGDAHQYLLEHIHEFDFIWASPPCITHSRMNHFQHVQGYKRYPDMSLYQEIIYLQKFFKGYFCVENVVSYYNPLIPPQKSGRHYFWANFNVPYLKGESQIQALSSGGEKRKNAIRKLGFDLSKHPYPTKVKLLKNCVAPEIGKIILKQVEELYKNKPLKN